MQAPQQQPNPILSYLPTAWQWVMKSAAIGAVILVISQNLDYKLSVKNINTELHYKGNAVLQLTQPENAD